MGTDRWGYMSITAEGTKIVGEDRPEGWVFFSYYKENDGPWTKPERRICVETNSKYPIEARRKLLEQAKKLGLISDKDIVSVLERAVTFDLPELEIYEKTLIAEARRV